MTHNDGKIEKSYLKVLTKFCVNKIVKAIEQKRMLCNEVKKVRQFAYLGDRVCAGGGCEVAATARIRYGWVMLSESGVTARKKFYLKLKMAVYKCYVWPAMLH